MQLEFHQLDRRWEHLRVRHRARQGRLLASPAESGQQTPIVVVAAEGQAGRYVVIDGYKRIKALEQPGRDTVEAAVWPMSEAAAVLLDRSLRLPHLDYAGDRLVRDLEIGGSNPSAPADLPSLLFCPRKSSDSEAFAQCLYGLQSGCPPGGRPGFQPGARQ